MRVREDALADERFLQVAAGQLLLALGVAEQLVRPLPRLLELAEQLDLGGALAPAPGPAGVTDEDLWGDEGPAAAPARAPFGSGAGARFGAPGSAPRRIDRGALTELSGPGADLLEQVLDRMAEHRIRPETLGFDGDALRGLLADARALIASPGLRDLDEDSLRGAVGGILGRRRIEVPPQKPGPGEVGRMVGVLRRMPRSTVRRIARVTSRPALTVMLSALLMSRRLESSGTEAGTR